MRRLKHSETAKPLQISTIIASTILENRRRLANGVKRIRNSFFILSDRESITRYFHFWNSKYSGEFFRGRYQEEWDISAVTFTAN